MPAPTFVAEYESVWNTSTTPKTVSVTAAVDDRLVCFGIVESGVDATMAAPTGLTGVTWTLVQSIAISNYCGVYCWTGSATQALSAVTASMARSGAALKWGFTILRWSGSDGFGASAKTNVASGAPSLALTTTGANSAVATANADWNATDGTTRTWRNGETEQTYMRDSAAYTTYVGCWGDSGAAGSKTLGLSAPTGQKYSIIGVEVLGTAAAGSTSLPPSSPVRRLLPILVR